MRGMEDHAAGLVDDDMPPVIEMPEIVEEKEETPVAEPEPEVAPPSPVEQPDLMCLDTPRAAEAVRSLPLSPSLYSARAAGASAKLVRCSLGAAAATFCTFYTMCTALQLPRTDVR